MIVRLIVVDTEWTAEDAEQNPLVLVNPEIVEHSGQDHLGRRAASPSRFRGRRLARVARQAARVESGGKEDLEIDASELQAVCFQHEIDHLDGVLFIDRISRLKRNLYTQRRKKQLRLEFEEQSGS